MQNLVSNGQCTSVSPIYLLENFSVKELPPYKQQTSKVMHLTTFILSYGAQCPGFVLRKKIQGHRPKIQAAGVKGRKLRERETVRLGEEIVLGQLIRPTDKL